jgi:hypothetical protein
MIEFELQLYVAKPTQAADFFLRYVDRVDFRLDYIDAAEDSPQRIDDITWRKITRRHFVQHGGEENEVLATNKRDLNVRTSRQRAIDLRRRV